MRAGFLKPLVESVDGMFALRNTTTGQVVARRLEPALDSRTRRRGLLGRDGLPAGTALVIAPSNAVHTFFMRFAIDVIFVRRDGRVSKVRVAVPARRLSVSPGAFAVIELVAGGGSGVSAGDYLEVVPVSPSPAEL